MQGSGGIMFKRIFCLLVLVAAPFVLGQSLQSQQLFDQLVAAGVSSSDALSNVITQNPGDAGAVTSYAIQAQPESLPSIIEAAVKANPDEVTAILEAGFDHDPDQAVLIVTVAAQSAPQKTPEIIEYAMERYPWRFASIQNKNQIELAQIRKAAEAKFRQSLNPSASEAARIAAKQQSESSTSSHVDDITERNFRRSASPN